MAIAHQANRYQHNLLMKSCALQMQLIRSATLIYSGDTRPATDTEGAVKDLKKKKLKKGLKVFN